MARRLRLLPSWSWIYGLCAVAVVGALAFVSRIALRLECDALCADERAAQQDRMRTALWRLDSYLLPILAREGARPYFEYLAYYPQERSYTRFLNPIEKGEVLVPSPLLAASPEHVRLHFQVDANGVFSSPQAPTGNRLDLAEATCSIEGRIPMSCSMLTEVIPQVPLEAVRAALKRAEEMERSLAGRSFSPLAPAPVSAPELAQSRDPVDDSKADSAADSVEWSARQKNAYKTRQEAKKGAEVQNELVDLQPFDAPPEVVQVGSLVPMWLGEATPELFLFRCVTVGANELLQGVLLDWPGLQAALLAEVGGLLPGATLEPLRELGANWQPGEASSLATIPVHVAAASIATPFDPSADAGFTAVRATLAMSWGAVLAALVGGFVLLRSSQRLGERRSRFASAVTHELRTPLTTFRMYSEMLADDMVSEPEQRRVYLTTLKEESGRLATLVENVLAYARLEDGRGLSRRERIAVGDLVARHGPTLQRHAMEGGMELSVAVDEEVRSTPLVTDADAVGQILFNLVDNARKYAREAADRRVECSARRAGRSIEFRVADHGPGVPPEAARRVFQPFERGPKNGDPMPGVGLGLALARGIAHDLGGELDLETTSGGGATFTFKLPLER